MSWKETIHPQVLTTHLSSTYIRHKNFSCLCRRFLKFLPYCSQASSALFVPLEWSASLDKFCQNRRLRNRCILSTLLIICRKKIIRHWIASTLARLRKCASYKNNIRNHQTEVWRWQVTRWSTYHAIFGGKLNIFILETIKFDNIKALTWIINWWMGQK